MGHSKPGRSGSTLEAREAERLDAIEAAEKAARDLVSALEKALSAGGEMRDTIRTRDLPVPLALAEAAMADRLSQYLSAVLATLRGYPTRFYRVAWSPTWRAAEADWRSAEEDELAEDLQAIAQRGS